MKFDVAENSFPFRNDARISHSLFTIMQFRTFVDKFDAKFNSHSKENRIIFRLDSSFMNSVLCLCYFIFFIFHNSVYLQNGEQVTQYNAGVGIVCMRLYRQILFAGCYDGHIYVFDTLVRNVLSDTDFSFRRQTQNSPMIFSKLHSFISLFFNNF